MTFRLVTLLYLFALIASSMAVLGVLGLPAGVLIFAIWAYFVFYATNNAERLRVVLCLLVPLGLVGIWLYFAINDVRTPSFRTMSINNLRNITLAILQYHSNNAHYPPPVATDDEGNPLYSWRVLVLPYLEQEPLAKRYRHDQPWDSPHNMALLDDIPVFQSPRFSPPYASEPLVVGETHYFAIVGDGTIWDPDRTVTESDVTDGLDQTMLLIEVQGTGIKWSEPRDFTLDEAIALLQDTDDQEWIDPGYFVSYRYDRRPQSYRCVAFADGRVDTVTSGNDPADLRAMLTRGGGEAARELLDWSASRNQKYLGPIVHWGRIWGFALWLAIILLPFYRPLPIFPPPRP